MIPRRACSAGAQSPWPNGWSRVNALSVNKMALAHRLDVRSLPLAMCEDKVFLFLGAAPKEERDHV